MLACLCLYIVCVIFANQSVVFEAEIHSAALKHQEAEVRFFSKTLTCFVLWEASCLRFRLRELGAALPVQLEDSWSEVIVSVGFFVFVFFLMAVCVTEKKKLNCVIGQWSKATYLKKAFCFSFNV